VLVSIQAGCDTRAFGVRCIKHTFRVTARVRFAGLGLCDTRVRVPVRERAMQRARFRSMAMGREARGDVTLTACRAPAERNGMSGGLREGTAVAGSGPISTHQAWPSRRDWRAMTQL
jgi:hypothetical protein